MRVTIRVTPSAHADAVELDASGEYLVRVRARAHDGEANDAATRAVAAHLGVAPSLVRIVRGGSSRVKVLDVLG